MKCLLRRLCQIVLLCLPATALLVESCLPDSSPFPGAIRQQRGFRGRTSLRLSAALPTALPTASHHAGLASPAELPAAPHRPSLTPPPARTAAFEV